MSGFTFVDNLPMTIEAGGHITLPVNCAFVYVSELVGGSVTMETEQGRVPLILGRRIEFPKNESRNIRLKNTGDTSAVMELLIGSGDVRDSNVVGLVSVVDGSVKRSEQGLAWQISNGVNGVAGEYPIVELKNKSSDKEVVVNQIVCQHATAAAGYILVKRFTPVFGATWGDLSANKLSGGASSSVVGLERGNSATLLAGDDFYAIRAGQDEVLNVPITEPYVLEPGETIGIQLAITQTDIRFIFAGYIK
ncbi:MAG: hypothetical protein KBT88_03500 [Gammaproteobacteria bacterium]|nr:hypothetical protein [Gammaproteobacteria bacterium]MBQ0838826.1 hypothetical protein [Gammaproteobacteria bacterium]